MRSPEVLALLQLARRDPAQFQRRLAMAIVLAPRPNTALGKRLPQVLDRVTRRGRPSR